MLVEFVSFSKNPCFVTVGKKDLVSFSNISLTWEQHRSLVIYSKLKQETVSPLGFSSHNEKASDLIGVVAGSMWDQVKGLFLTEGAFGQVVDTYDSAGFSVNSETQYSDLVFFLKKNGYSCVDAVGEKGDYAIRGGIVDVYLYTKNNPVRCSFFDTCELSLFNVSSQSSVEKIAGCFIPSLLGGGKKTIGDLVTDKWLRLHYSSGVFGCNINVYNPVNFPLTVLSYNNYISLKNKGLFFLTIYIRQNYNK